MITETKIRTNKEIIEEDLETLKKNSFSLGAVKGANDLYIKLIDLNLISDTEKAFQVLWGYITEASNPTKETKKEEPNQSTS